MYTTIEPEELDHLVSIFIEIVSNSTEQYENTHPITGPDLLCGEDVICNSEETTEE